MLKKNLALYFLLTCSLVSNSQVNDLQIGHEEFPTTITSHAADSAGNMYYAGNYKGELKIEELVLQNGAGLEDIFLIKKDAFGQTVFSKSFGSAHSELSVRDGLAYYDGNLYMIAHITDAVNFQSFAVTPYPGTVNAPLSCIVNFDTAGNVKWVNKTSLILNKIYSDGNIIHIIGSNYSGAVKFNDTTLYNNTASASLVHLMLDLSGNLISYKLIEPRKSESFQNIQNYFLAPFSDGRICMLLEVSGDSSFSLNNNTIPLPGTFNNYFVLVKTDTSYSDVEYKVLNPPGLNFANTNGQGLTIHLSKQDSLYLILTENNYPANLEYDGLSIAVYKKNVLVVLDSSLQAKRAVDLGDPFAGNVNGQQNIRVLYKTINTTANELIISGTYYGLNESPAAGTALNNQDVSLIPNVTITIDANGASKSFIAKASLEFSNGAIIWLGDHSEYEDRQLNFHFSHLVNDSLLVLALHQDNVWNPRILNVKTNALSGAMRPNADRADNITFVEYLGDGSRIIMGVARGRTALDTATTGIKSNQSRGDAFLARITIQGEVKWYKRFYSSLLAANPQKLVVKNNLAYFLINYGGSVNQSDYLIIDGKSYPSLQQQSLFAAIDTSGNLQVINLKNSLIKDASLSDFNFCVNGDLAVLTGTGALPAYPSFPQTSGFYIFRLTPSGETIITERKLIPSNPFSLQPSHLQIDSNDNLYLSFHFNASGSEQDKQQVLSLYDSNNSIDTVHYEQNVSGISLGGLGVLKMNWNKFNWYKRTDGNNGFSLDGSYPAVFLLNNQITFMGNPINNSFFGDTSSHPFYWDRQLVIPDMHFSKTYFFRTDTSGNISMNKTIKDFNIRYAKKRTDGSLLISGSNSNVTSIDTTSIGFDGGHTDATGFVIDSGFNTTRSFRLASPYVEYMSDVDVYKDSLVSIAYMAQTTTSFYSNRTKALATDNSINAYLSARIIGKSTVLGIQLVSFYATHNEENVSLNWTSMSDEEGERFVVQRSHNGLYFKDIEVRASINGPSLTTYNSRDKLNDYGNYYYRLKIISADGKISYSKIAQILYPPKSSSFYYDATSRRLYILRTNNNAFTWRIIDISGRTVLSGPKVAGSKTVDVSRQSKGEYIVHTADEKGVIQTYKLIR